MIQRLHHIAIICSDKEKTIRFYQTLGFSVIEFRPRQDRGDEIVFMECCGTVLELFIEHNRPLRLTYPEAYGLRHIAFSVDNLSDTCKELHSAGYDLDPIRKDMRTDEAMTFVKDPDGLPIELREKIKK